MSIMAGPKLTIAISCASGLGFVGPGARTQDTVADLEVSSLFKETHNSSTVFHKPITTAVLPVGVGFLLWKDDANVVVAAIESYRPCSARLYAPNQSQEIDVWSRRIRNASPHTQIWIQIGTLSEAKALLESPERPDVIAVQGSESVGHGRVMDGMSLMTLFLEVADAMAGSQIP